MNKLVSLATAALIGMASPVLAESFEKLFPGIIEQLPEEIQPGLKYMDLQQGKIPVGGNIATINVPEGYYFLGPNDAEFVLSVLWENPASSSTLGMIFPTQYSPLHQGAWGIEISFEDIGYVSDDDAEGYDYDDLLKTMQADTREDSAWRTENGYPSIELVGWATPPHYDSASRKLYWAQRLRFGGEEVETLNYNIRALGRKGVLVVNFISSIDKLEEVEAAAPEVLAMVNFTEGNRYSDFDPGVDKVAAVGIGGLIAGKVLAKSGFLAVALIFLKKFWFVALIPLLGLKKLFTRNG